MSGSPGCSGSTVSLRKFCVEHVYQGVAAIGMRVPDAMQVVFLARECSATAFRGSAQDPPGRSEGLFAIDIAQHCPDS